MSETYLTTDQLAERIHYDKRTIREFSTTQGWEDRVAKRIPQLNPKTLEALTDIGVLEGNVNVMLKRTDLTPDQRSAGEEFLKGMECIRQGKNPDRFFEPE